MRHIPGDQLAPLDAERREVLGRRKVVVRHPADRRPVEPAHQPSALPVGPWPAPQPAVGEDHHRVLLRSIRSIDELAVGGGGSRQVPVEKGERETPPVEEESWPLDMNRPFKRETTPVEKTFFS